MSRRGAMNVNLDKAKDTKGTIKRIIKYHIKMKDTDINYLLKITMIPKNKKDQALLNTLLIDYI